jgi:hypothetical protein
VLIVAVVRVARKRRTSVQLIVKPKLAQREYLAALIDDLIDRSLINEALVQIRPSAKPVNYDRKSWTLVNRVYGSRVDVSA